MGIGMNDQRGITIMEVLIAVAILGVGLVALSSAIPIAAYGIQEGNQLSTATFLASQRMEQVRNAKWTACPEVDRLGVSASVAAAPSSGSGDTFPDEDPLPAPYAGYSRQVRITNSFGPATCPGGVLTGTVGLRQVTVTVSYRPMTGVGVAPATTAKSAVLTMYIAQR
jgi:prepilin-type N-terminal cleavage/methylation domain-containing protein